jgi:steroid delta-isomerase-like uncharacterized protein
MKKLLFLALTILFFAACEKQEKRYTQSSSEIDTVKKLIANYNSKAYDMTIYADTSKTNYNSKEKGMSPGETLAYHQANDAAYSSRGFLDKDQEYEMVLTDDGQTWVNCWLDWQATLVGNDKEINMPVHLTYRFIDGKIVREVGMWDPTEVVLGLQEIEAAKNMPVEEQAIKNAIQNAVKAWNTNDKELMYSFMDADITRTTDGIKTQSGTQEYGNMMDLYHNAFSNFTVTMRNSTIKDNKAYISWAISGTNTGSFLENPATNKKINVPGFSVWTFNSDGKATQEDAYADNLAIFQQLGYKLTPPE